MKEIFEKAFRQPLIKAVFSKPADPLLLRCTARPFEKKGAPFIQFETFTRDGKALHENLPLLKASAVAQERFVHSYRQCNLITANGECEIKISKSGHRLIRNRIKDAAGASSLPAYSPHNKEKNTILQEGTYYPFLAALGVCDERGRIFDRKRAKFKQINRFLEIIDDVYPQLPAQGPLIVCDLCCGKSYLTFAAYHYFTKIKGREITMYGVDRKADVIEFCQKTAEKAGAEHLYFSCGDVTRFSCERADMVLSLHACDIATDIVLSQAVKMKAQIILSTPCCHHEMMGQLSCPPLGFLEKHSLLKQKLCEAATDALRALRLEAEGYKVTTLELIDPEQTPKNMMIKAIRKNIGGQKRAELLMQYRQACDFLGVSPALDKMLISIDK